MELHSKEAPPVLEGLGVTLRVTPNEFHDDWCQHESEARQHQFENEPVSNVMTADKPSEESDEKRRKQYPQPKRVVSHMLIIECGEPVKDGLIEWENHPEQSHICKHSKNRSRKRPYAR
ncbi:MAG: hypothetical protein IH587_13540 [Anaerolineae bacterium]|nr:hypothetical protein [Anaerolineae bacterium]